MCCTESLVLNNDYLIHAITMHKNVLLFNGFKLDAFCATLIKFTQSILRGVKNTSGVKKIIQLVSVRLCFFFLLFFFHTVIMQHG